MPSNDFQPSVLLLSESKTLAALEQRALREVGVSRLELCLSGLEAARSLAAQAEHDKACLPDVIVCGQKLSDMDGERFCAMLRLHPLLLAMPVLLVLPNDNELEQLQALGCGASALLARPYSIPELKRHLQTLKAARPLLARLRHGAEQTDNSAFDAALKTYGSLLRPAYQPADYFRVGMQCLQNSRWNNAIEAFHRALRDAQIKGEAELGIAAAWKGKGDMPRFRAWLARSAETFVQARRWHRACSVYATLKREDPQARNPYLTEVGRLLRQQQYDQAADVLAHCFEVTPMRHACGKVARTCLGAEDPQRMLRCLETSLGRTMGTDAFDLSGDIRVCLNNLAREQEARRRQAALERQRQLARQTASLAASQAACPTDSRPGHSIDRLGAERPGTERLGDARYGSIPAMDTGPTLQTTAENPPLVDMAHTANRADMGQNTASSAEAGLLLAPLTETDATSRLFTDRPRFNELLSVVKCTWKLARRHSGQERPK